MKNNLLGKIAMSIKHLGKAKLNFSHDVSTTAAFGDLQPTTCKLIQPNSNGYVESRNMVRFGTMVAPTFGRIKSKEYHHLVPISDLFENFAYMLAQGKRATGVSTNAIISPTAAPHMTLGLLSRFCLVGARVEIYAHNVGDTESVTLVNVSNNVARAEQYQGEFNSRHGMSNWVRTNQTAGGVFSGYQGTMFNLGRLTSPWAGQVGLEGWNNAHDFWIPVRNDSEGEFFGVYQKTDYVGGTERTVKSLEHIPMDKASLCLTTDIGDYTYTFVFRLSSFGKRLRKAIIGSGKQINLCSTAPLEVVSLCAIWKAYFDLFGLTLYENYEITPLAVFCKWIDLFNYSNLDAYWWYDEVWNFMLALGQMWYTDAQDIVSAHVASTAISPSLNLGTQFIDVNGTGAHVTEIDNSNGTQTNGHAFINAVEHGALDAEYLMKLYVWCNKNTIAGKAIEKVLRAQGLGKFVDSSKSNFIGYHEEMMQVFDVVSTADTFKDGQGSMLGEYGGRGIKVYDVGKKEYNTDEYAFRVSLFTIVPDAGYLQAIDPAAYAIKKTDFLLADFDGSGMEATHKTIVCGAENWSSQNDGGNFGTMEQNFGFVPRGSHLKLSHNISNGDITLRDTRDGYLPYTCDKFIDVGERMVVDEGGTDAYHVIKIIRMLSPNDIPHASLHYRYPCRYPWIGHFERIFAYQGEPINEDFYDTLMSNSENAIMRWEFLSNSYDNFIVHSIVSEPCWSPCKAIEESFETFEEGDEPNAKMDKA